MDSPFNHVVVLMMENQSFDRIFGFVNGIGKLTGQEFNLNAKGEKVYVSKGADPFKNQIFNPPHSFKTTYYTLFGQDFESQSTEVKNQDFVKVAFPESNPFAEKMYMQSFDESENHLPAITTLAKNFIVCDRWYCSVPGATGPNRLFVHGASSFGYVGSNYQPEDLPLPKSCESIFESLQNSGYSWKTYVNENLKTSHSFPFVKEHSENHFSMDDFYKHALNDQLPTYSFLGPDLIGNSQHPGEAEKNNMIPGDNLIGKVYETIRSNQKVWEKTLLIITYDEAGGYYDSTPSKVKVPRPPALKEGNWPPNDNLDFDFSVLGVRVPTLLISPWFDHKVDHTLYEHSSIPATLKNLFNLKGRGPNGFLTCRDQNANDFLAHNVLRKTPRTDVVSIVKV
jgi:phospholipase C